MNCKITCVILIAAALFLYHRAPAGAQGSSYSGNLENLLAELQKCGMPRISASEKAVSMALETVAETNEKLRKIFPNYSVERRMDALALIMAKEEVINFKFKDGAARTTFCLKYKDGPNLTIKALLDILLAHAAVAIGVWKEIDTSAQALAHNEYAGVWISKQFGELILSAEGSAVNGVYVYKTKKGIMHGGLTGVIEGSRLNYRWWEGPAADPDHAMARGDGYMEIADGVEGKKLAGKWRNAGKSSWDGHWSADRQPPRAYAGIWRSKEWGDLTLEVNDGSIFGSYQYSTAKGPRYGRLKGGLAGGLLMYRWWEGTTREFTDAAAIARGDGHMALFRSGQELAGKWRNEGRTSYEGNWSAVRRR